MPENDPHTPEQPQYFTLSSEQAERFASVESERLQQLAADIGIVAAEGAFGVVVDRGEDGKDHPVHLIYLTPEDPGTRVDLSKPEVAQKHGDLEAIYSRIMAEAEATEPDTTENADGQAAVETLLRESEFAVALQQFESVAEGLQQEERQGLQAGNQAHESIMRTKMALRRVAELNPRGRLAEHADVRHIVQTMEEEIRTYSRRTQTAADTSEQDARRYSGMVEESANQTTAQLRSTDGEAAVAADRLIRSVTETVGQLHAAVDRTMGSNAEQATALLRMAGNLQDITLSVEEAIHLVTRMEVTLGDLRPNSQLTNVIDNVRIGIGQFRKATQ